MAIRVHASIPNIKKIEGLTEGVEIYNGVLELGVLDDAWNDFCGYWWGDSQASSFEVLVESDDIDDVIADIYEVAEIKESNGDSKGIYNLEALEIMAEFAKKHNFVMRFETY